MIGKTESNFKIEVEQIRAMPSNSRYFVSDKGRIYSKKSKRFLLGNPSNQGYATVGIYKDGKCRFRSIHQLVMEAFVGPRPSKYETNHIDGNKLNNTLANLEYCTQSENAKHSFRLGLQKQPKGEKSCRSKLTDLQVREIRMEIVSPTMSRKELAKKYNICQQHISYIKHNPDYRKTI
jgi:hypothetical protein